MNEPNPATAAAEAADEICQLVLKDTIGCCSYQPGWQNLVPIISKHYAAQAAEIERLKVEVARLEDQIEYLTHQ